MTSTPAVPERFAVNLGNCHLEPIHIPGRIQPHGALLVLGRDGMLVGWSENLAVIMGFTPQLHLRAADLPFDTTVLDLLSDAVAGIERADASPQMAETFVGPQAYDVVVHSMHGLVVAEFEERMQSTAAAAHFAVQAHRTIDRLKRRKTRAGLLDLAVSEIFMLTGFDRVMAYRFRQDDSGEVVSEARRDELKPYLGHRYPASDIPAQARRLYTENTLRLIADVGYAPVPVLMKDRAVLDMSQCVLRSVSPIHVEYLKNIHVAASMSVSIVVNGRLWGLIACHHMTPRRVAYTVRMACDVIAQVLASSLQSIEARERAAAIERGAGVRGRLLASLFDEEDVLSALTEHGSELCSVLTADALVGTQHGRIVTVGAIAQELAADIVRSLPSNPADLLLRRCRADWPASSHGASGPWVGLLGLCFDPHTQGWVLLLRKEQTETIEWGRGAHDDVTPGPSGARLTPKGSFTSWLETIVGTAEGWDETGELIARQLLADMQRATNARRAEFERAQTHLMAMLGHDLRDPLASIAMIARALEKGGQPKELGERIRSSSTRMQRLITHVMDLTRLRLGIGLGIATRPVDLSHLINDLVEEAQMAYPAVRFAVLVPPSLIVSADFDRLGQAIGNLLGNARLHGTDGDPIEVRLGVEQSSAVIRVANVAPPIQASTVEQLFVPFKKPVEGQARTSTGLGLGLYIAHEIARGHGGTLTYQYAAPRVEFTLRVPL